MARIWQNCFLVKGMKSRFGFPLTYLLALKQLQKMSWVKISQIRTLSVERVGKKLGAVEPEQLVEINDGFNQIIGL